MEGKDYLYDDKYCLAKISEGDEFFFSVVFRRYRNKLFIYLLRIIKSREKAEEIVMDVFLKIWHGRTALPDIQNLEAFLYKVAYNKAIDFFRTAKRNREVQHDNWEYIKMISDETADRALIQRNTLDTIRTAVSRLSAQRKKVYDLRTREGMSYEEIARRLNLSSHTVRNHLAASIQFIKEFIIKNDV